MITEAIIFFVTDRVYVPSTVYTVGHYENHLEKYIKYKNIL